MDGSGSVAEVSNGPELITALGASAFAGVGTAVLCRPVVRWLASRKVLDVPVAPCVVGLILGPLRGRTLRSQPLP